ncbi:MAG: hypothetical protein ACO3X1_13715 [Burkholderiaceae bacterium]
MKETFAIVLYSIVFLIISIAGAGLLFLFALPFSMLLLVGVVVWGLSELVRYVWHDRDTLRQEVRLGPSRRVQRPTTLDLRSRLSSQSLNRYAQVHRLQFVPNSRRHAMRGRMTALSMRHPHHAQAHSS